MSDQPQRIRRRGKARLNVATSAVGVSGIAGAILVALTLPGTTHRGSSSSSTTTGGTTSSANSSESASGTSSSSDSSTSAPSATTATEPAQATSGGS
jgi:cytoskeletal protein RodZ